MVKGNAAFVLPRFNNKVYFEIKQGETFGQSDFGYEKDFIDPSKNARRVVFEKDVVLRHFTVQAFGICELLAMSIKDLLKIKLEFPKVFSDLFHNCRQQLNQ